MSRRPTGPPMATPEECDSAVRLISTVRELYLDGRDRRQITDYAAALEMQISASTLHNLNEGIGISRTSVAAVIAWYGRQGFHG